MTNHQCGEDAGIRKDRSPAVGRLAPSSAAPTVAPRIVRVVCPQCGGASFVVASSYAQPQLHLQRCSACAGVGAITVERAA